MKLLRIILPFCFYSILYGQTVGSFKDPRDGRTYSWIEFSGQRWMLENLKYLPHVDNANKIAYTNLKDLNNPAAKYFVYDYWASDLDSALFLPNYNIYGVLYNWTAATKACPDGWHLPSDEEWMMLERYLGMSTDEAKLYGFRSSGEVGSKLINEIDSIANNGNNRRNYSMNIVPSGQLIPSIVKRSPKYRGRGKYSFYWTSTRYKERASNSAIVRGLFTKEKSIWRHPHPMVYGNSVRCVCTADTQD